MKAVIYTEYGPPEVARLVDIPKPEPKPNEVLVKVYTSTVSRSDAGFRSADYFISRFWTGLFRPKHPVLGCDFAGVVDAIGSQVTTLKVGDRVFGFNDNTCGGHGEYLTRAETDAIALIPEGISFDVAAAIPEGAHYALVDIKAANVTSGQQVLVNGATGAIGSAAVQLLKYYGAKVTAVCDTENVALVKSLGADEVIDYKQQDFTKINKQYDFIFDAVGKSSFGACKPLLKETGIYISTELGKNRENVLYALTTSFGKGKKLLFPLPTITKQDLVFLAELVQKGKFKPVIDRYYTLDQMVEAYRYVESGQKIGNVVLKVAE